LEAATVDQSGRITAVCTGEAVITVTAHRSCYNDSEPVEIAVTVEAGDIAVSPLDPKTLKAGETWDIPPVSNLEGATFTYNSDNGAVATVDQSGRVTAICAGEAEITVIAHRQCYADSNPVVLNVTVTVLKGDVVEDGSVNILDVVMAIDIALERINPSLYQKCAADMDSSGAVDVNDVRSIIDKALDITG
ncbi:MAG: Ig-like domain-containing protein, partial [Desulfocucumaceae bacterium]